MIQRTIEETKRIQLALRPAILDELGVLAGIDWLCKEFHKTHSEFGLEEQIDLAEEEIPDSLKTTIFRISQAAMNNIAGHRKAQAVRLSLRKTPGTIELLIEDNGHRFDMEEVLSATVFCRGFGLISMRERAKLSGGSFAMHSTKGAGTVIRTSWPI